MDTLSRTGCRLFLVLVFAFANANAEGPDRTYVAKVETFFESVGNGEEQEAIRELPANSPYAEEMSAELENVAFQLSNLGRTLGEYRNHELLIHDVVAERFAYMMFFVAYDRQPLKMEFQFYRPDEDWVFLNYSFSGDLENELVEVAKFKLMNFIP
ncbi:MAG: hypothetical protein AAFX56_09415 [Pseudomonadota bacterium]